MRSMCIRGVAFGPWGACLLACFQDGREGANAHEEEKVFAAGGAGQPAVADSTGGCDRHNAYIEHTL